MQGSEPVEYMLAGLAKHQTVGDAWRRTIRKYYEAMGQPGKLAQADWVAVARVHQPWKYMLFGDPSLRLRTLPTAG